MLSCFEKDEALSFFEKTRALNIHEKRRNDADLLNLIASMETHFSIEDLINQAKTNLEGVCTGDDLHLIQCECLLIHGKQDFVFERDMSFLREKIPNAQYVGIDQCGHMVPIEKPEAVSSLISLWLS